MKKNILLIVGVLAMSLTLYNCKKEADPIPNINLTPVYALVEIDGSLDVTYNVYKDMAWMSMWNKNFVYTYETLNYNDSSIVDSIFKVNVTSLEEVMDLEDFVELKSYELESYEPEEYVSDNFERDFSILAADHMDTASNVGAMDIFTEHIHYERYVQKVPVGEEITNLIKDLGTVTDSIEDGDELIGVTYQIGICQDTITTLTDETKSLVLVEEEVYY